MTKRTTKTTAGAANPGGLPRGCGSIQMRRRTWWLIYWDADGVRRQENSWTADTMAARRMLAKRALAVLRARIAAVKQVMLEDEETQASAVKERGCDRQVGGSARHQARD